MRRRSKKRRKNLLRGYEALPQGNAGALRSRLEMEPRHRDAHRRHDRDGCRHQGLAQRYAFAGETLF